MKKCENCELILKGQPYYRTLCEECDRKKWRTQQAAEELAKYEKAVKVPISEYKGDAFFLDDKYYEEIEDALDGYLPGHEPEYAWAVVNHGVPKADIGNIIEHCLEEMWEDADDSDLNGLEELEAAVNAFNEANSGITVWMVDYSTAVLL